MKDGLYLPPIPRARYAIGRKIGDRWIRLVQNTWLEHPDDAETVLRALGISVTLGNLDHYFPERPGQGRCPTLELLERFYEIGLTKDQLKKHTPKDGV